MSSPLLMTKLYIPSVRPELVSRPRLIERLNAGLDRKLTVISAPAGFGKTTLVSEWVSDFRFQIADFGLETTSASAVRNRQSAIDNRVAWVSLDEGDNDPAHFLAYFIAAIQTVYPDIGESLVADLHASQPPPIQAFLTTLINEIAAVPERFILVLDDYHLITAQPIHDGLSFLLDHLPPGIHLVIATRADPSLPLARLRARGQLTELRQSDLRFTTGEAAVFLNQVMGLDLSPEHVAGLESRTEGWIAGLQMASLAILAHVSTPGQEDVAGFIRALTGSDRYILDYLVEEVLQHQPESVQAFLLQTSILNQLTGTLCDAVRFGLAETPSTSEGTGVRFGAAETHAPPPLAEEGEGQATLERLEQANLFIIPLDNERRWYRYHRLFADLLRSRLNRTHPNLAPTLHRRASRWYEQHGLMASAIDHALATEDLDRAADLIEQNAEETLMRGEVATFLRWVAALPDDQMRARPSLCVLHAWMLLLSGQPLEAIESRLQDADAGDGPVTGRITALRALIVAFQGQVSRAAEMFRQALAQLDPDDRFIRDFATWILSVSILNGEGGAADHRALDEVFRTSQRTGNVMIAIMVMCNQAELCLRQGQLRQAAATYRQALELATDAQGERAPIAGQALVGLGELYREWNDLEAATRYLTEGIQLTDRWTETGSLEAYLALARVRQGRGNLDGAWEAARKAQELAVKFDITQIDDLTVALFQARLSIAGGDLEAVRRWAKGRELVQYIDAPLKEESQSSIEHRLLKYELLVLARLLIAEGRSDEALALLEPLLPIAERRNRPGMVIEIYLLQALALQAQGDLDRAMAPLERALSLAEPEGYARIFLDEGEPVARLLYRAVERGIAPAYGGRLLAAFPALEPAVRELPPEMVEALSDRELDVLRLIAEGLSNQEIAQRLVISLRTVKWHASNIYGKLGVKNRTQAVAKARSLGILPIA